MLKYLKPTYSSHDHSSQVLEDAPDKPPTTLVTVVVVLSFFLVFAVIAFSFPVVQKLADARTNITDTGMGNSARLNYLAQEQKILSTSLKIDDNRIQIPIEQAMKMVVETQGNQTFVVESNAK